MARRVETAAIQIEQRPDPNNRRVEAVGIMVEYRLETTLYPTGIPSEEDFGTPLVTGGFRAPTNITQNDVEATVDPTPATLVTQHDVEAMVDPGEADAQVSQHDMETLIDTPNFVRITQLSIELLERYILADAQVSQHDMETLIDTPNFVRITQLSIELLRHIERKSGYILCAGEEFIEYGGLAQVVTRVDVGERLTNSPYLAQNIAAGIREVPIGTRFTSMGLGLAYWKPSITVGGAYNTHGSYLGRLEERVVDWSHSIDNMSGFKSASLTLATTRADIEDWLENGLGRHVELYNEANQIIWEGFVDKVEASIGPLSYGVGPLMAIGNVVNIIYTPVDVSVDPPTRGATTSTVAVMDESSVARYGQIAKTLSAGECTDAEAEQYRDFWLAANSVPMSTKDISLGEGGMSIRLYLLGYSAYLNVCDYASDSISYTTVSDKLKAVLAADPNGMFSTNYAGIEENLFAVPESEPSDKQRMMWDVIKSLVELGDVSYHPTAFGIYAGRKARYLGTGITTVTYRARLDDPGQNIYTANMQTAIRPWNILPGKWIQYTDLMVGRKVELTDLRYDPRAILIQEVSYSFPWKLNLRGMHSSDLPQLIAQLGYNG